MPEKKDPLGRVVLEINCRNKAEAYAAIDMIKTFVDSWSYNSTEAINQTVIVTDEGEPLLEVK
ncbi:MAG: hypothetical protein NC548_15805 [Lachnospiraceae bacterium]|nr:hypothetical protein [Lachnospiraceae bacterium]